MLYSAVIVKMVKDGYEQEKSKIILERFIDYVIGTSDMYIRIAILIYFSVNILSSQHFQHDSLVNTIFII